MPLENGNIPGYFKIATIDLKLCPNRVWAVAGKNLPKLLPLSALTPRLVSKDENDENEYRDDDELCTFDFCEYSQRDFTAVGQRHECKVQATCIKLRERFLRAMLERTVLAGNPTIWNLTGYSMLEHPRPYMAVSHVWSDGTRARA
ncbi:hypothetical protein VE03_08787 [Pseudogymnoascus sp. 23342-1-I1]|nr:hypothetical protein VE03_08787 [Pseudogymnoascus sp. 23342-1-I1]